MAKIQKNRSRRNVNALCAARSAWVVGAWGIPLSAAVGLAALSAAHAQTPFQVIRPESGATVRETVRIQMSRRSLDDLNVKYLSLSIDGKFRQAIAVLPLETKTNSVHSELIEANKQIVSLLWDTKVPPADTNGDASDLNLLGVEDGTHTLDIIAQDADGKHVGEQKLTLNVQNRTAQMPADGLAMNYRFEVGDTTRFRETTMVEYIGDNSGQNQPAAPQIHGYLSPSYNVHYPQGGSPGQYGQPGGGYNQPGAAAGPFTVLVQNVRATFERTTEDNLGNDTFFIRDKVDNGTIIAGNGTADRLENVYTFKSRYRTVTTAGAIKDGGIANSEHPGAYIALPIPDLGGGRRRIGQTWTTRTPVKLEWATLDRPPVVSATNTLEGLEWQDGYQTARIRQSYNGKASIPIFGGEGVMRDADVKMERTIWFAYSSGKIIRSETDVTVSGPAPVQVVQAMAPSAGVNAPGIGGPNASSVGGFGGFANRNDVAGPGPSVPGGGFGALLQQNQEIPMTPAKFHSRSIVELLPPEKS